MNNSMESVIDIVAKRYANSMLSGSEFESFHRNVELSAAESLAVNDCAYEETIATLQKLQENVSDISNPASLLAIDFDEPSNADWDKLRSLSRKDAQSSVTSNAREEHESHFLSSQLSEARRHLLQQVDEMIEQNIYRSTRADYDLEEGKEHPIEGSAKKAKKRKVSALQDAGSTSSAGIGDPPMSSMPSLTGEAVQPPSSIANTSAVAANHFGTNNSTETLAILQLQPLKRRNVNTNQHYKASDVLRLFLVDMPTVKQEIVTVDTVLTMLQVSEIETAASSSSSDSKQLMKASPSNILQLIYYKSNIGTCEEDTPLPLDAVHLSRTVTKISTDYLKSSETAMEAFDHQRASYARESTDRYRRRWDSLLAYSSVALGANTADAAIVPSKFSLSEIPVSCDRVPNPFSSLGMEQAAFGWLKNIFSRESSSSSGSSSAASSPATDRTDGMNKSRHGIKEEKVSYDSTAAHQDRYRPAQIEATQMLVEIMEGSAANHRKPLDFFEAVERCANQLYQGLNFILVDQPSSSSSSSSTSSLSSFISLASSTGATTAATAAMAAAALLRHEERFHHVIHRAMIMATILCVFHGAKVPQSVSTIAASPAAPAAVKLHEFVQKLRDLSPLVRSNNQPSQWGPILIVCKLQDMEGWEAGLREVCADYSLEILPYFGSDQDRATMRSYLRSNSGSSSSSAEQPGGGLPQQAIGAGLYSERSHVHILLMNYETLFLDVHFFKDIAWYATIYDEPWAFFCQEAYQAARSAILQNLKTRHRLLTCSSLMSKVTQPQPAAESSATTYQLPDIVNTLLAVYPCALGMSYHHDSEELAKHGLHNNASSKKQKKLLGLPIRSTHNATEWLEIDHIARYFLLRLLGSLTTVCCCHVTVNNNNSKKDQQQQPAPPMMYLPYEMMNDRIPEEENQRQIFQEMYHRYAAFFPTLTWFGMEMYLITPFNMSEMRRYVAGGEMMKTYRVTIPNHASTSGATVSLYLLLSTRQCSYMSNYFDEELKNELKNLNLATVGCVGSQLMRFLATPSEIHAAAVAAANAATIVAKAAAALTSITSLTAASGENSKKTKQPKQQQAVVTAAVDETQQSTSDNTTTATSSSKQPVQQQLSSPKPLPSLLTQQQQEEVCSNHNKNLPSSATISSKQYGTKIKKPVVKDDQVNLPVKNRGRVPRVLPPLKPAAQQPAAAAVPTKATGAAGSGSGDGIASSTSLTVAGSNVVEVKKELEESTLDGSTAANNGDKEEAEEEDEMMMDGDEGYEDEEGEELEGDDEEGEMVPGTEYGQREDTMDVEEEEEGQEEEEAMQQQPQQSAVTASSQLPPPPSPPSASLIAEYSQSILKKGKIFYLHINAPGRQRFLGVFEKEDEPFILFQEAFRLYQIDGTLQLQRGSRRGGVPRSTGKLIDGAFIADDYYPPFSEEDLYKEIEKMILPQQKIQKGLSPGWISIYHDPPVYAMLRREDGVKIPVPALQLILGRMKSNSLELLEKLGERPASTAAAGLIFDYDCFPVTKQASKRGSSGSSNSNSNSTGHRLDFDHHPPADQDEEGEDNDNAATDSSSRQPICAMHVGEDTAIARYHARLWYDATFACFMISALEGSAGIYVDGAHYLPGQGPIPLKTMTILQLGNTSYFFCLPTNKQQQQAGKGGNNTKKMLFSSDMLHLRENLLHAMIEQREMRRGKLPSEDAQQIAGEEMATMTAADRQHGADWDEERIVNAVEAIEMKAIRGVFGRFGQDE